MQKGQMMLEVRVFDGMDTKIRQRVEVWDGDNHLGDLPASEVNIKLVPSMVPTVTVTMFCRIVQSESFVAPDPVREDVSTA